MLRFSRNILSRNIAIVIVLQLVCALAIQVFFERQTHQALASFRDHGIGLYELQLNTLQLRRYEKDYFLAANDPVERPRYLHLWRDYQALVQANLDQVRATKGYTESERAKLSEWTKLLRLYSRDFEANVARTETHIIENGKIDDIVVAYSQMSDARRAIRVVLGQAHEITVANFDQLTNKISTTTFWTRLCLVVIVLLGILLAFSTTIRLRVARQIRARI